MSKVIEFLKFKQLTSANRKKLLASAIMVVIVLVVSMAGATEDNLQVAPEDVCGDIDMDGFTVIYPEDWTDGILSPRCPWIINIGSPEPPVSTK